MFFSFYLYWNDVIADLVLYSNLPIYCMLAFTTGIVFLKRCRAEFYQVNIDCCIEIYPFIIDSCSIQLDLM